MANQDNVSYGGIGQDPSSAYAQIETGFDPTYVDGVVQWKPTSASSVVADTGDRNVTLAFDGDDVTVNGGVSTVLEIAHTGTVDTTIGNHTIVVTDADGGDQATGAFEAGTTISSNGTNVTITWNSDDALGTDATGSVTILTDIDEPAVTTIYGPVPVVGASNIKISSPVTANAEITAQFQWTDDDDVSIDGTAKATWNDLGALIEHDAALSETELDPGSNVDWAKLDKMKFIRIKVVSTDLDVGGVVDAGLDAAYIEYELKNTLESNVKMSGTDIGGDGTTGIGPDPS